MSNRQNTQLPQIPALLTMIKEERHYYILDQLRRDGKVIAIDLSRDLDVSEDTIRRDLRDLAAAQKLQRVHGGALLRAPAASVAVRESHASEAKATLAQATATLFEDGQVIVLDGGTTNVQVARHLPTSLRATVITPSPAIALSFEAHPFIEIILLGGKFSKYTGMTTGIDTAEAIRSVRADVCVLGICSLHPDIGVTVQEREEALLKQAMVAHAAEIIAVAVADKLDTALPYVVGPVSLITHLVTERKVQDKVLAPYEALGVKVVRG